MSIIAIFLIIAIILFIVSALGVPSRVNLQSAGLAFVAAAMLVPLV